MQTERTGSHGHTVLLVEDNLDSRDALQALLTAHGYDVVCALDGAEALELAHREPRPCVIVLDLRLPRVDGYEFRRVQRADPTIADIPVVAVSSIDDLARHARTLEASDYVRKPLDVARLVTTVAEHCGTPPPRARDSDSRRLRPR